MQDKTAKCTILFLTALCAAAATGLYFQGKSLKRTQKENQALHNYADAAQNFAKNVTQVPLLPDFTYCNDTNCMTCRAVKNTDKRYAQAAEMLGVDMAMLNTLRQGPNNQR